MRRRLFAFDKRINGWTYGFQEMDHNGRRAIGHYGDTVAFNSILALLPDEGVGLFASYNSQGGVLQPQALWEAFLDHYHPAPADETAVASIPPSRPLADFTGVYRFNRMAYTTPVKITAFLSTARVRVHPEGGLVVNSALGPLRFVEVQPLLFREVQGDGVLAFREDEVGEIRYVVASLAPDRTGIKVTWYEAPLPQTLALAVIAMVSLLTVITAIVSRLAHRRLSRPRHLTQAIAFLLAFWILVALALAASVLVNPSGLVYGEPGALRLLAPASILVASLTVVLGVGLAWRWQASPTSVLKRMQLVLMLLAGLVFVGFLDYWNLLGWRLVR
jgi:hypothetical protein